MKSFYLEIPTRIHFGRGVFDTAIEKEKEIFSDKVLLVTTGRSLIRLGYIDELRCKLASMGVDVCIYDQISTNPELEEVKRGIEIGQSFHPACVIGFGGGSAMDAAKAIAAGLAVKAPIEVYYFEDKEPENSLPLMAIPTTAGTGSELSKGAILSDKNTHMKKGLRGKSLYPTVAIVDSRFTESVPYEVTIDTGFDVFAHAVESYVSAMSTSFSNMLSINAIKIVSENLPKLVKDLKGKDAKFARDNMSYASMIMGINLGNVGTALPHRLQYPVGDATGTSHGAGLMALYPAWIDIEYEYSKEKLDNVARIIAGLGSANDAAIDAAKVIKDFINSLKVRRNLQGLGIEKEEVGNLSGNVTAHIQNDPASKSEDVINTIYRNSFSN